MLKNIFGSSGWKFGAGLALGLVLSSSTWAAPISTGPYAYGAFTGWVVDDGTAIPETALEAILEPWEKQFAGATDVGKDEVRSLTEFLFLSPVMTLDSWTETLSVGSGWEWIFGDLKADVDGPGGGGLVSVGTVTIGPGGQTISFTGLGLDTTLGTLDPMDDIVIPFVITKDLKCIDEGHCAQRFSVLENAVPEPGTLLLLAAGLAGLGLRRRRHS